MSDKNQEFKAEVKANIDGLAKDKDVQALSRIWVREIARHKYAYNFTWMGRPLIQFPQDMVAMQEIIWQIKPDLIIETGIAHGGSIIYYASILELIGGNGKVLGIDIDIRDHNRAEIESHPMFKRIELIQGSSTSPEIISKVKERAKNNQRIMVILDSNHTHEHVIAELNAYAPLTTKDSYCVVMDTLIEDLPTDAASNRPWGPGNNPKTAVIEFLKNNKSFIIDESIEHKLLITVAPSGYLKKIN